MQSVFCFFLSNIINFFLFLAFSFSTRNLFMLTTVYLIFPKLRHYLLFFSSDKKFTVIFKIFFTWIVRKKHCNLAVHRKLVTNTTISWPAPSISSINVNTFSSCSMPCPHSLQVSFSDFQNLKVLLQMPHQCLSLN